MMTIADLTVLLPLIWMAGAPIMVMLAIPLKRSHGLAASLSLLGLGVALVLAALVFSLPVLHRQVTPLLVIDGASLFFIGLIIAATVVVTLLSHAYLAQHGGNREEFYVLLLIAAFGAAVLSASSHFASLFLGLEILTVSLYGLIAYLRESSRSIEAGVKYLILAAVSSAFLLFGMSLVYAATGALEFSAIASAPGGDAPGLPLLAGISLMVVGIGFKLAIVPFHLWTPDVYEGAPAPVTAFVATVSKGAVFAVMLRFFTLSGIGVPAPLVPVIAIIAAASMFAGNLLALFQNNVKRLLAFSSIAHLGYLLVSFLAGGRHALTASAFYITAYIITTLGAFGVVSVLSRGGRDADSLDDYRGLAWRRPWIAAVFTSMLLSLAGIPLTAGFVGKFYLVAAGVDSSLWLLVSVLVVNSVIGLFYYLRVIAALYSSPGETIPALPGLAFSGGLVLAGLTFLLIWIGLYPGPVIDILRKAMPF